MNSLPLYWAEVARLQRAVSQACGLLAELGEDPDVHADARAAVSRVSRLTAYGAHQSVLGEAVDHLRERARRLEWRLQAVRESVMARGNAIAAALMTVEEASLTRANGRGSAGACPASTCAKTPAAGESVGRVAAGSAADPAPLTPPAERTEQRTAGGGIGR
jgi:hypothetical protein